MKENNWLTSETRGPTLPPASTEGTTKAKEMAQSLAGTRTTRPKRVTPVAVAEA